jgi:hypothetical protein
MRRNATKTVQFDVEQVSSLLWNHCPVSRGMGVHFAVEYACFWAFWPSGTLVIVGWAISIFGPITPRSIIFGNGLSGTNVCFGFGVCDPFS